VHIFYWCFFLDLQWVSAEIGKIFTDISLWSSMSFLITKKLRVQRFDTKKSETEMCIALLIFKISFWYCNKLRVQRVNKKELETKTCIALLTYFFNLFPGLQQIESSESWKGHSETKMWIVLTNILFLVFNSSRYSWITEKQCKTALKES
jgi:hypothetical protein